jgi:hypothetical protein
MEQALQALKLQFSSDLNSFLHCAEQHAGLRSDVVAKASPNLVR